MIKNIPNKYTQKMLLQVRAASGFCDGASTDGRPCFSGEHPCSRPGLQLLTQHSSHWHVRTRLWARTLACVPPPHTKTHTHTHMRAHAHTHVHTHVCTP
jgi:hypothetical protein